MSEPGEKSYFGRFDASKKPKETDLTKPELIFIDQSSPFQPYVKHGELEKFWDFSELSSFGAMVPTSDEGFAHNDDRQHFVGETLAKLFSFQKRGKELLEVGYGVNPFIAEGITKKNSVPVCLLDFNNVESNELHPDVSRQNPPRKVASQAKNLPRFVGDMTDIDEPASALKNHVFGGIFYNGSWVAGGNNWTVMQIMEGRYHTIIGTQPDWDSPEYRQYKNNQLNDLLQTSINHLTPKGVLYIGSSRYAYHGTGYSFDKLPEEKVEFLDVIRRLKHMGAKKLTVIGISSDELDRMYLRNIEDPEYQHMRTKNVFEHLFLTNPLRGSARYRLRDKDDIPIPSIQLEHIASSPEQLESMLSTSSAINDIVQKELKKQQEHGASLVNQLTGGLESLPSSIQFSAVTPEDIERVQKELKGFFDPHIGRIDAVAAEF